MKVTGGQIRIYAVKSRLRHSFLFMSGDEAMSLADARARFTVSNSAGAVQAFLSSELGSVTLDAERVGECVVELDRLHLKRLAPGAYRYELTAAVAGTSLRIRGVLDYLGDLGGV